MATGKKVSAGGRPTAAPRGPRPLRFEATLGPAARQALAAASALDLDRLPDAQGQVRLLVSPDDARRLLEQGFEVHLKAALPVAPLAPSLAMSDAQAKSWLDGQLKGIARQGAGNRGEGALMYRTVAQIDSAQDLLSRFFPTFFTRVQLPEASVLGHPVFALRLRAGAGTTDRRAVLVVGGTHARELMNPDAIIELAIDLFLSYANGTNIVYGGKTFTADDVKLILEAMDIWLVPCVNPDGRTHVMTVDDMWRKNRRDNPGTTCDGVDLNRNADIVWGVAQGQTSCSPCADTYCGPSAFSEPEGRNVKHLLDTLSVVSFVDVHSFSELVLFPWGHAPTQTTDPTKRFTGLTGGTCTASIPSTYKEYMPPVDQQRFTTVAAHIVADIAAVRGRHYTPETAVTLYATTGTQSDYAYSRHIANPALRKTYGFTFETGPDLGFGHAPESFHPTDPTLIKRDAKAAILSLMQESVCAIELIGAKFSTADAALAAMRRVRDTLLASTPAGRAWISLFERLQFALVSAAAGDANLLQAAGDLVRVLARTAGDDRALLTPADAASASALLKKLRPRVKIRALRADIDAMQLRIGQVSGHAMRQVIESLMKRKPVLLDKPVRKTASKRRAAVVKTRTPAPKKKAATPAKKRRQG